MDYFVSWEIELTAGSPVEAAKQARAAQTRRGTMATVFDVHGGDAGDAVRVDLTAVAEREIRQEPEVQDVFSRVELATILHGLRFLQQVWHPNQFGLAKTQRGYSSPGVGLYRPAEQITLSDSQIVALCKRIEVALT
jgi:hypothetical protein